MDKQSTTKSTVGLVWIAVGTAIGYGAAKMLSKKKTEKSVFDFDSIVKTCEKASAKLDKQLGLDRTAKTN